LGKAFQSRESPRVRGEEVRGGRTKGRPILKKTVGGRTGFAIQKTDASPERRGRMEKDVKKRRTIFGTERGVSLLRVKYSWDSKDRDELVRGGKIWKVEEHTNSYRLPE